VSQSASAGPSVSQNQQITPRSIAGSPTQIIMNRQPAKPNTPCPAATSQAATGVPTADGDGDGEHEDRDDARPVRGG
jgi:hypothetical protein